MRTKLAALALAILTLTGCAGPLPAPPTSPTPQTVTALFVGDSYTEGVGLASPREERWSSLVAARLGWSEVNAGCSGSGYTRRGLTCGNTFAERIPSLSSIDADVVLIWGGVNDAGASSDDAASAARDTIAAYARAFPDAELVIINAMYFATPEPSSVTAINSALAAAAQEPSGRWIDIGPILAEDPSLLGPDGLHPNAQGHRAIADAVLAVLAEPR
jgi:lysophospholipase L1-like esterase